MELQPSDVAIGDDKLAATGAIQNTQDVLTVTTTAGLAQTPDAENHSSNSDAAPPGFPSRLKAFSKKQNRQFAAICWSAGVAGWNDACAGALLPWMERYYDLNYIQVSTLFIGAFSGFVLAAFVNNAVTDRLGMGKTVTTGAVLQACGYAALLAPPPFPLLPAIYAILIGFGMALLMAQSSAWLAALPRSGANLNYGQASYGLGALLSPLAATSLASSGVKFSYFFGVSLGLATLNSISLFFAFGRDSDHRPQQRKRDPRPQDNPGVGNIEMQPPDVENVTAITRREGGGAIDVERSYSTMDKNRLMLRTRIVWATALFLFFYVGAEVSIGGWAVSFLLQSRGGTANVGYVATDKSSSLQSFWSGITLGRLTLPHLQARVGDRKCLYGYIVLSLLLELSVWFWRQLIGNAVAICLIGYFLSTFFGIGIMAMTRSLPKPLHTGAIGLVAAAGQAGSAAFPFLTGALAQKYGPVVLQPVIIALLVGMGLVFHFGMPEGDRRAE